MKLDEVVDMDRVRPLKRPFSAATTPKNEPVGSGVSGVVYKSQRGIGDTVTKFHRLYDYDPKDDPYLHFIRLAVDNQNNPYFPRIKSVKIVNYKPSTHLVVQMEKLAPMDSEKTRKLATHLLRNQGIIGENENVEHVMEATETYDGRRALAYKAYKADNEFLFEALNMLEPLLSRFGSDLHSGNWMIRLGPAPQLVITDPVQPLDFAYG